MALVEFKIFGKTRLLIDGTHADLGTAKQRGVLTLLLLDVGRPVPIDLIIDELWPGESFDAVKGRLQPIISRVRKVLTESGSGATVVMEGRAYRLQLDPMLIDLHRFRHLVQAARNASTADDYFLAKTLLQDALALWQGKPLGDLNGTWSDHCRAQMEQFDRLPAYYLLFDSQLQLLEYVEVMSAVGRLAHEHDTEEMFARQYMQSLCGMGKYPKALEFYREFCDRLFHDLGAEPGPEMCALYQEILRKQSGTGVMTEVDFDPPQLLEREVRNFTGRKLLLTRLDALLDAASGQVVLLHGMPCAGKTSLVTRWAHLRKDRFPDGQLFLDLRGYGPETPMAPEDAIAILLASLGVTLDRLTVDERHVRLRKLLSGKRLLLILDNVRDGAQIRRVLAATANCCCLVTSRTQLPGLTIRDGVQTFQVPPLTAQESVALLRAELSGGGRMHEAEGLAALARLSEGLPLGLKIIAQHVVARPYTPLEELAREFQRHEGLGVLDSADSDDEGATLSGAFAWSFRALPAATARAFRLLGMLPSAEFGTLAACVVLSQDEPTVEAHLRMLAKANLVQQNSAHRYRLHDLLYGFAVDLAQHEESHSERESALRALLDWYLATASNAAHLVTPGRTQVPALDGISYRGAVEFVTADDALAWFAQERTNLATAVSHAARNGFHAHAWRLSANMNEAFDRFGFYTDLRLSHEIALASARNLGDLEGECGTLNNLGLVQHWLGLFDEAQQTLRDGAALAQELGHRELLAICLHNQASVYLKVGEVGIAIKVYERVLELLKTMGDRNIEAYALDQLANAHHHLERDDIALEYHSQALAIRQEVGDVRGEGTTFTELSKIHHQHGEMAKALQCAERALDAHTHSGDKSGMGKALLIMAETLYDLGSFAQSAEAAQKSIRLCPDPRRQARGLHVLGHAEADRHDLTAANRCWNQAVDLLLSADDPRDELLLTHLRELSATPQDIPGPRTDDTVTNSMSELPLRD